MAEADNAVNDQVVADTTSTAPAADETQSTEVANDDFDLEESFDDGEGFGEESDQDETESDQPEADQPKEDAKETDTVEKPQTKADERKEQLKTEIDGYKEKLGIDPNTEIRDYVAAKNALKSAVEEANAKVYQPVTADELLEQENPDTGEYFTKSEAKFEAFKQQQEIREYNERVAEAQMVIEHESQRVINDFPMFDPKSDDYQPEIANEALEILKENLIRDEKTGQIIGSNLSPYKFYKTIANSARLMQEKGQINGQKATEKMLASADSVSSVTQSTKPKSDLDIDGFDEEANRW